LSRLDFPRRFADDERKIVRINEEKIKNTIADRLLSGILRVSSVPADKRAGSSKIQSPGKSFFYMIEHRRINRVK
jgi:hypothetical protein